MAWFYLVCLAAAGLGLLLAGIGICVEAHTNRRVAQRPRSLREELASDLARARRAEQDRHR